MPTTPGDIAARLTAVERQRLRDEIARRRQAKREGVGYYSTATPRLRTDAS